MSATSSAQWLVGALIVLAVAGCQMRGEPGQVTRSTPAATGSAPLEAALEASDQPAREWQDEPRLAQIAMQLDEEGAWRETRLDYVAAGSERMLSVFVDDGGVHEQRVSLEPLDLPVLPEEAVEGLPPLPESLLPPNQLIEAAEEAIASCGLGAVEVVVYTTGAPATWDADASAWSVPPDWRVVIADAEGSSVAVDPVTADAAVAC